MPEAVGIRGAGVDVAGLRIERSGGCLQCPRLLRTAAQADYPGCGVRMLLLMCSWSVGEGCRARQTEMLRHKAGLRDESKRELQMHTFRQGETHTHTPEREREARGQEGRQGNQRRKWSKKKRRRWAKKETSQDAGGRGGGLAANARRGLWGKISAPWVSPAGWPFWSRGWGQFSAKGHVINKQALGAIQFLLRVLLRKRGKNHLYLEGPTKTDSCRIWALESSNPWGRACFSDGPWGPKQSLHFSPFPKWCQGSWSTHPTLSGEGLGHCVGWDCCLTSRPGPAEMQLLFAECVVALGCGPTVPGPASRKVLLPSCRECGQQVASGCQPHQGRPHCRNPPRRRPGPSQGSRHLVTEPDGGMMSWLPQPDSGPLPVGSAGALSGRHGNSTSISFLRIQLPPPSFTGVDP